MNTSLKNCVITDEDLKYAIPLIKKVAENNTAEDTLKSIFKMVSDKGTLVKALSIAAIVPDVLISLNIDESEAKKIRDNLYNDNGEVLNPNDMVSLYKIINNTASYVGIPNITQINTQEYKQPKSRKLKPSVLNSGSVYGVKTNTGFELYYVVNDRGVLKLKYKPALNKNTELATVDESKLSKINLSDGIYKIFEFNGESGKPFVATTYVTISNDNVSKIEKHYGDKSQIIDKPNNNENYEYIYKILNQPGKSVLYAKDTESEFFVTNPDDLVNENKVYGDVVEFKVDGKENTKVDGAVLVLVGDNIIYYAHKFGDKEVKPGDKLDVKFNNKNNTNPIALAFVKNGEDIGEAIDNSISELGGLDFIKNKIAQLHQKASELHNINIFDILYEVESQFDGLKSAKTLETKGQAINNKRNKPKQPKQESKATAEKNTQINNEKLKKSQKSTNDSTPSVDNNNDIPSADDFANNDELFRSIEMENIHDVSDEQNQEAIDWFNKHSFHDLFKLKDFRKRVSRRGKNVVATWTNECITLYKGSDNTSIYHESFHGMFWMFLNDRQRKEVLDELRGNNGEFVNMNGDKVKYSKASDLELEEVLAEGFRDYMLTGSTQFDLKPKTRTWFQKLLDFLKELFGGESSYFDTNSKIQKIYDDLKLDELGDYESNFSKDNGRGILREQTVLQRDSFINIDKLDKYKIGDKSLLKIAEQFIVDAVREMPGRENFKMSSDKETRRLILSNGWSSIRPRLSRVIDDAIANGTFKRIKNNKETVVDSIEVSDMDGSVNGVVTTKSGVGLNEQKSKDVNDMMISLYVSFMRETVLPKKDNTQDENHKSLSEFIDFMSTDEGKTEFFAYAKNKIDNMETTKGTNEDIVINFVKANFGNINSIQENLNSRDGKVYGVIGYFIKNNPNLFLRSAKYEDTFDEGSSEEAGEYVHALMEWDRSGNESRLADLLKSEIRLLVSTIPLHTQRLDSNGHYVVENGAIAFGFEKNKYKQFYKADDEKTNPSFMSKLQNPRIVMNKIQEIVKNSPDFKTFIHKMYEASGGSKNGGFESFRLSNARDDESIVDFDIREVVQMLGGISSSEIKNNRFDSLDKQDIWTAFFASFSNTSEPGKLVRLTVDFSGYDRSTGKYLTTSSLIDGSAASRDALNVLNQQFKLDLYHNAKHDIFGTGKSRNDRLGNFASSIDYNNEREFGVGTKNPAGEVVVCQYYDEGNDRNKNITLIPKKIRYELKPKYKGGKLPYTIISRVQVSDHRIVYKNGQRYSVADYVFFTKEGNSIKWYNKQNTVTCINVLSNNVVVQSEIFEGDVVDGTNLTEEDVSNRTDDKYYEFRTRPSFVSSYINNGVNMMKDINGNYVDQRAVLGMLMLNMNNELLEYTDKDGLKQHFNIGFNILDFDYNKGKYNVNGLNMRPKKYLGFSFGMNSVFSSLNGGEEVNESRYILNDKKRINRMFLLRAIGLFMHNTPEFNRFLNSSEYDNRIGALLETILDNSLSNEYKQYSITDVFQNGTQQMYMLKDLMGMEAKFLNSTASYSQRTGDNNMSFENSLNSTLSVMVDEMNRAIEDATETRNGKSEANLVAAQSNLKKNVKLSYLNPDNNPMIKHSKLFRMMYGIDGSKTGVDENDNIPDDGLKLQVACLSGMEIYGNGAHLAGSNAYQADRRSRILNDIILAFNGIFSPIQHSDKKRTYAVVVPHNFNKVTNYRQSNTYIDISDSIAYSLDGESYSGAYNMLARYFIDYAIGEIEYANDMYSKYKAGILGKADYRTLGKIVDLKDGHFKPESSLLFDILKKSNKDKSSVNKVINSIIRSTNNGENVGDNIISSIAEALSSIYEERIKDELDRVGDFTIPTDIRNKIAQIQYSVESFNKNRGNAYQDTLGDDYDYEPESYTPAMLNDDQIRKALTRHFYLNSLIHATELSLLFYGNLSQFNADEFTKRVGGFGSTGNIVNSSEFATNQFLDELVEEDDNGEEKLIDEPLTYTHKMAREVFPELYDENGNVIDESKLLSKLKMSLQWGETLKTMVCNDLKVESVYSKYYEEMIGDGAKDYGLEINGKQSKYKEGDAFALITFDKYRQYLISEKKWTRQHEQMYRDIVSGKPVNMRTATKLFMPVKAQYIGPLESSMNNTAFHKYQLFPLIPTLYGSGSLMDQLHKRMMHEGIGYMTFKSGSKLSDITDRNMNIQNVIEVDGEGNKSINKNLGSRYADTSLIEKHDEDFVVYSSDTGDITSKEYVIGNNGILFKDGDNYYFSFVVDGEFADVVKCNESNGELFIDGEKVVLDDYTNVIYTSYLKDQLVIHDEYEENIVNPSQLRKILGSNVWNGGIPNDLLKLDEWKKLSKKERLTKWEQLSEEEKRNASPLYKKFVKYTNALTKLRDYKKMDILKKLGAIDEKGNLRVINDIDGKQHLQFDKNKVVEFVNDMIDQMGLEESIKDIISVEEDANGELRFKYDIRSSIYGADLEKKIVTQLDRAVTQFRVYGETLIQAPNTFFGEKINFRTEKVGDEWDFPDGTNGLQFYTKKQLNDTTTVVSMKVKVPLLGKFKNLLDLNEVKYDDDGNLLNDRERLDRLNAKLKTEDFVQKYRDLITMVSVRIPTQGYNSIEMMEVYEFLPPEGPNSIILPSEIVVKSGGDYDIDKMPIMMPHIHKLYSEGTREELDVNIGVDSSRIKPSMITDSMNLLSKRIKNNVNEVIIDIVDKRTDKKMSKMIDMIHSLLDYKETLKELKGSLRTDFMYEAIEINEQRLSDIKDLKNSIESEFVDDTRYSDILDYINNLYAVAVYNVAISKYDKEVNEAIGNWKKNHKGEKLTKEVIDNIKSSISEFVEITGKKGKLNIPRTIAKRNDALHLLDKSIKTISNKLRSGSFSTAGVNSSLVEKIVNDTIDYNNNRELLNKLDDNILENEYRDSIIDMLRDESIFNQLITPNSTSMYEDVKSELSGGKKKSISDLIDPIVNQDEREAFVAGKEALGIGAVDNVLTAVLNQIALTTTTMVKDNKGEPIIGANVALPFEKYNKAQDGSIDLSQMYDADYDSELSGTELLHDIQNKISQIINGFVDVAKDPWVKSIGADKTRTPALLFMLQAGVSIEEATYLCVNPYVRDFCINIETRRGSLNSLSINTSTNKKDLIDAVGENSILRRNGLKMVRKDANGKEIKEDFDFSRHAIATLLDGFKFDKSGKHSIKQIYKKDDNSKIKLIDENNNEGFLTYNDIAALEFLQIKYMADDLTEIKLKISQDTKVNGTSTDIEQTADFSGLKYFDIDEDILNRLSKTPVGIFNDKMFISDLINSLHGTQTSIYDFIHSFVLKNKDKINSMTESTLGEFEMELMSVANMILYQRALRKFDISDTDKAKYLEGYNNHLYPADVRINSIEEYAAYRKILDNMKDSDVNQFFIDKAKLITDDVDKQMSIAKSYQALHLCFNHDAIFSGQFSFPQMFQYYASNYPQLSSNIELFNIIKRADDSAVELLTIDAQEEDIPILKENIKNLKDAKFIKSLGIDDNKTINDIVNMINYLEKFVMLQSDGSVEGKFGVSVLGNDVERMEMIKKSDETLTPEEVFINWYKNRGVNVGKFIDGDMRIIHSNGNSFVEIDGLLYSEYDNEKSVYDCSNVIKLLAGTLNYFDRPVELGGGSNSRINTIQNSLGEYLVVDRLVYDIADIKYKGTADYKMSVTERTTMNGISYMDDVDNGVVVVKLNKCDAEANRRNGINFAAKFSSNTKELSFGNPFEANGIRDFIFNYFRVDITKEQAENLYAQWIDGANILEDGIRLELDFRADKNAENYTLQSKLQDLFWILKSKRSLLHRAIKSGLLVGRQVISDEYGKNAAAILKSRIDNPTLINSLFNNYEVVFNFDKNSRGNSILFEIDQSNRDNTVVKNSKALSAHVIELDKKFDYELSGTDNVVYIQLSADFDVKEQMSNIRNLADKLNANHITVRMTGRYDNEVQFATELAKNKVNVIVRTTRDMAYNVNDSRVYNNEYGYKSRYKIDYNNETVGEVYDLEINKIKKIDVTDIINDGKIDFDKLRDITDEYFEFASINRFRNGRKNLATRKENSKTHSESFTIEHLENVVATASNISIDNDMKTILVLAAALHDISKPFHSGLLHGPQSAEMVDEIFTNVDPLIKFAIKNHMMVNIEGETFSMSDAERIITEAKDNNLDVRKAIVTLMALNYSDMASGSDDVSPDTLYEIVEKTNMLLNAVNKTKVNMSNGSMSYQTLGGHTIMYGNESAISSSKSLVDTSKFNSVKEINDKIDQLINKGDKVLIFRNVDKTSQSESSKFMSAVKHLIDKENNTVTKNKVSLSSISINDIDEQLNNCK